MHFGQYSDTQIEDFNWRVGYGKIQNTLSATLAKIVNMRLRSYFGEKIENPLFFGRV